MAASFEVGYVPSSLLINQPSAEFSDSSPVRTTNYSITVL
jgi:hypothetical protein